MLPSLLTLLPLTLAAPALSSQNDESTDTPAVAPIQLDEDANKTYYLLLPEKQQRKLHLVVTMPGGTGQAAEFLPWMQRVREGLGNDYAIAVVSAPNWKEEQEVVWVTDFWREREFDQATFAVEDFVEEVVADAKERLEKKPASVSLFGWSSAGPAVYAASTRKKTPFDGFVVHCSVFKREQLKGLKYAKKRRYYLLQGTEDQITRLQWAEDAKQALENKKAKVELEAYEGGHGWDMPDPFGTLRRALTWVRG